MLTYKNQVFCKFWTTCQHGSTCTYALTDHIKELAKKCMLPINTYNFPYSCYKKIEEILNEDDGQNTRNSLCT
jgi:hypothetical protein